MVFTKKRTTTKQQSVRQADPCIIVIFGASGDLTKRKLIPALYNLASSNLLPEEFAVVGVARHDLSSDEFRDSMSRDFQEFAPADFDPQLWDWLKSRIHYLPGEFQSGDTYGKLKTFLAKIDREYDTRGNYLYYLATAPRFFCDIVAQLGEVGLARESDEQWRRVVIEKPFGQDLASAQTLNRRITSVLDECQIYRIDHYLGKETVQNILMFRFGNAMFEPIWNYHYIDHVQITVAETVGVGSRGGYYEGSGALRDMVQNHLFQLLAMVAMEAPVSFDADAVRDEKSKVLKAVLPMSKPQPRLFTTSYYTFGNKYRCLLQGGLYFYPATNQQEDGKLRLLYECAPLAFVAEQAGGKASTGQQGILDLPARSIHQRSPLAIGSTAAVSCYEQFLQTGTQSITNNYDKPNHQKDSQLVR